MLPPPIPAARQPLPSPTVASIFHLRSQSIVDGDLGEDARFYLLQALQQLSIHAIPENMYMAAISALMRCLLGHPRRSEGANNTLDISGDIALLNHSRGGDTKTWERSITQQEIRTCLENSHNMAVGLYKPDALVEVRIRLEDSSTASVISLVGEGKIDAPNENNQVVDSDLGSGTTSNTAASQRSQVIRQRQWRHGLAKAMLYLVTANEVFGTSLAYVIVGPRYSRLVAIDRQNLMVECSSEYLAGIANTRMEPDQPLSRETVSTTDSRHSTSTPTSLGSDISTSSNHRTNDASSSTAVHNPASEFLKVSHNSTHLAHTLYKADTDEFNQSALNVLFDLYRNAIELLLSLPLPTVVDPAFPPLSQSTQIVPPSSLAELSGKVLSLPSAKERINVLRMARPKAAFREVIAPGSFKPKNRRDSETTEESDNQPGKRRRESLRLRGLPPPLGIDPGQTDIEVDRREQRGGNSGESDKEREVLDISETGTPAGAAFLADCETSTFESASVDGSSNSFDLHTGLYSPQGFGSSTIDVPLIPSDPNPKQALRVAVVPEPPSSKPTAFDADTESIHSSNSSRPALSGLKRYSGSRPFVRSTSHEVLTSSISVHITPKAHCSDPPAGATTSASHQSFLSAKTPVVELSSIPIWSSTYLYQEHDDDLPFGASAASYLHDREEDDQSEIQDDEASTYDDEFSSVCNDGDSKIPLERLLAALDILGVRILLASSLMIDKAISERRGGRTQS